MMTPTKLDQKQIAFKQNLKTTQQIGSNTMQKYLIALPIFKGGIGFNHPTILVSAVNKSDAIAIARHLKPDCNIGDVKQVHY
jgi:hypothetical protein